MTVQKVAIITAAGSGMGAAAARRLVVPHMRKQGSGAIVNISTAWAFEHGEMFPTSAVFRAGLAAFTKIFADTCAKDNIRVHGGLTRSV